MATGGPAGVGSTGDVGSPAGVSSTGDMTTGRGLRCRATGPDRWIGPVILLLFPLLAAGWVLPVFTVRKLLVLSDEVSVFSALAGLWSGGHVFLAVIVGLFSVAFPVLKLVTAACVWYRVDPGSGRMPALLSGLSELARWSMLDVFVAALTVVAIQVSLVGSIALNPGLYCFVAAIVLSMLVMRRIQAMAARPA